MAETRVSVIVPTYCSGEGLLRVVGSLDAQTLPQEEFEAIYVDDGSPDDTYARLQELAASRPRMRVTRIENSGWPSRPRNVGLDLAQGEYVVFMDHDDELFPEALADAYAFARRHDADVVTGKEVKTTSRFFAWPSFQHDVVPGTVAPTPRQLMPMTPHKLYRRDFLLEHGLRFREGRQVQWEDIYFNLDVFARTDRIGVLASRPFYHWVTGHGSNSSDAYASSAEAYWTHLESVVRHATEVLEGEARDEVLAHNYGLRVLRGMFGPSSLTRSEAYYAEGVARAPGFVERWLPAEVDRLLGATDRARSHLLRSGRLDLLRSLAEVDAETRLSPPAGTMTTHDGLLRLSVTSRWSDRSGEPLWFGRRGDRVRRILPDAVADALPEDLLDVTEELAGTSVELFLVSLGSQLAWPLRAEPAVALVAHPDRPDRVGVEVRATVDLDARTAALGGPLAPGVWRLGLTSESLGVRVLPWVAYDGPAVVTVQGGRLLRLRPGNGRTMGFRVGRTRTAHRLELTEADVAGAVAERGRRGALHLVVPVTGPVGTPDAEVQPAHAHFVPADGGERLSVPAELRMSPAGAEVRVEVSLPRGDHDLELAWGRSPAVPQPARLTVGRRGRAAWSFVPERAHVAEEDDDRDEGAGEAGEAPETDSED